MAETAFPREIMAHLDDLDNMSTTQVDQVVSRTIGVLCRSSPATDGASPEWLRAVRLTSTGREKNSCAAVTIARVVTL